MCGLIGFWGRGYRENSVDVLGTLKHRGPDNSGEWWYANNNGPLWLGHRRLSILDLSEAGHQPMVDPKTGNVIIYNGEVYNYKKIRHSLEQNGQTFISNSDTEVILALFTQYGINSIERLRGMFAIVIWESKQQRLWLIRNRLGIKPLYIYRGSEGIAFASECRALKALLSSKDWKVNRMGLASYMAWGSVSEPDTLWQE